jgi:hypothetical protein
MLEGLGFSFLEPSHNFSPIATRAGADGSRSHSKGKPRRARSDSEALCLKMLKSVSRRRSDGNDENDDEADD